MRFLWTKLFDNMDVQCNPPTCHIIAATFAARVVIPSSITI